MNVEPDYVCDRCEEYTIVGIVLIHLAFIINIKVLYAIIAQIKTEEHY